MNQQAYFQIQCLGIFLLFFEQFLKTNRQKVLKYWPYAPALFSFSAVFEPDEMQN